MQNPLKELNISIKITNILMRKAVSSDQKLIIDIITESFIHNPSVLSVVKNDHKIKHRIAELAKYAFKTAVKRNGVYISSDNQGVAICYKYNEKKESFTDYWNQLNLAIKSIGLSRVIKILKREGYVKNFRPKTGDYLYFWFFGVSNKGKGRGAALELKDAIIKESINKELPIYLETSVEKNKIVYERYGFEVYHTWYNQSEKMTLWFMKRNYNNQ
jgi:hypothetical protein